MWWKCVYTKSYLYTYENHNVFPELILPVFSHAWLQLISYKNANAVYKDRKGIYAALHML